MGRTSHSKKIKVAWFASAFVGKQASGTGQVAKKIISNLIKNHADEVEIFLLARNTYEVDKLKSEVIFSGVTIIPLPNVFGSQFQSARQFYKFCITKRKLDIDILHYSVPRVYPFFWLFPAKKIVCTFHAGGDITAPRDSFVLSREIYNFIMKKQWPRLDGIVAVSKFGAREIISAYSIPSASISIIYPGSNNLWGERIHQSEKNLNIVLVIGRWQTYKNLHTIINSFKKLEIPSNPYVKLKVIGKSGAKDNKLIIDALQDFPDDQIELVEYLSDSELAQEYRNASVVFHPSINEGFGLPAFEAFGEGARLIAHIGTPAHEILASQSGVIFGDMLIEGEIIDCFRKISTEDFGDISRRRALLMSINSTWELSTKKYLELYKNILKQDSNTF